VCVCECVCVCVCLCECAFVRKGSIGTPGQGRFPPLKNIAVVRWFADRDRRINMKIQMEPVPQQVAP
jgi:hypothetical protein